MLYILIFAETLKKHQKVTWWVMELLEKNKLYLWADKCEFKKTMIKYLGVIILDNSVAMDQVKVAGIRDWPVPMNKKEVQTFLGFTNFYWRFIQRFSEHTCPLFNLIQNNAKWSWNTAERTTFDRLKESVTSVPVLISPDFLNQSWQLGLHDWSCPFSSLDRWWKMVPSRLHVKVTIFGWTQLWDPWQRDAHYYLSPTRVEALHQRRWTPVRDMDGPQKPQVLHGSKTAQSKTSPVVTLPLTIWLPPSLQTREIHGKARHTVLKGWPWDWQRWQLQRCPPPFEALHNTRCWRFGICRAQEGCSERHS